MNVAMVRAEALNKWEMQTYEPLSKPVDITAFASRKPDSWPALKVSHRVPAPSVDRTLGELNAWKRMTHLPLILEFPAGGHGRRSALHLRGMRRDTY